MDMKTYTDDDLQDTDYRDSAQNKWEFIADIPGDNPDLLGDMDNHEMKNKLLEFGAISAGVEADCEMCCSYYYFKDKQTGARFIKKLNQYLLKKAELIETARSF